MAVTADPPATSRLCFERFGAADTPGLAEILADPEVTRNITASGASPALCAHYAERRIAWHNSTWDSDGYGVWALRAQESGLAPPTAVIGWCGFTPPDLEGHDPEILYGLRRDCRGQGLGPEAARAAIDWFFDNSDFPGVSAIISEHLNPASVRVVRKLGFLDHGTMGFADFLPEADLANDVLAYELWRLGNQPSENPVALLHQAAHRVGQLVDCGTGNPATVAQDLWRTLQHRPDVDEGSLSQSQVQAAFQEGRDKAFMDWYHLPRAAWQKT